MAWGKVHLGFMRLPHPCYLMLQDSGQKRKYHPPELAGEVTLPTIVEDTTLASDA